MKAMQTLVEKYSHFAEVTSTDRKALEKLTVVCIGAAIQGSLDADQPYPDYSVHQVLTGATGSLGAHLLDQLLALETVAKVFCLVRATSEKEALQRVDESLAQRRLSGLKERGHDKVEAYPADLSLPDL